MSVDSARLSWSENYCRFDQKWCYHLLINIIISWPNSYHRFITTLPSFLRDYFMISHRLSWHWLRSFKEFLRSNQNSPVYTSFAICFLTALLSCSRNSSLEIWLVRQCKNLKKHQSRIDFFKVPLTSKHAWTENLTLKDGTRCVHSNIHIKIIKQTYNRQDTSHNHNKYPVDTIHQTILSEEIETAWGVSDNHNVLLQTHCALLPLSNKMTHVWCWMISWLQVACLRVSSNSQHTTEISPQWMWSGRKLFTSFTFWLAALWSSLVPVMLNSRHRH